MWHRKKSSNESKPKVAHIMLQNCIDRNNVIKTEDDLEQSC